MKKQILPFILVAIVLLTITQTGKSQVPTGFNYQAVIRNSVSQPLASQNVSVRITLTDNTGTPVYYKEIHTTTTNAQGVVNLTIGGGSPQDQTSLSNVQWKDGNIWIKVEVDKNDGGGYASLGLSQLQSVPYAQYAVGGNWSSAHTITSNTTAGPDDAIFEVKNKDGNVVFGVYQGGVQVNVEDGLITKGARGGFAVGGLTNQSKSNANYLTITPDSARIYVKQNLTKGARGGFAVGGLTNQGKSTTANQLIELTPNNYFIGFESGINITSGLYNSFFGYQSGKLTTSGSYNVFSGYQSGLNNTYGGYNVISGYQSGMNNTSGSLNVFVGYQSGKSNTDGASNVFIGDESGLSNTTGWSNNFIGQGAGFSNTTGTNDIFIGNDAGRLNLDKSGNTYIGRNSGYYNTLGWGNTYVGHMSGEKLIDGSNNSIFGVNAANNKTSGDNNVILGSYAGLNSADGGFNVFVGAGAGNDATGSYNVFIGNEAGYSETGSNKLYINNSSGSNPLIGGDFGTHKVTMNYMLNLQSVSSFPSSPSEGDIVRLSGPSPAAGLYIYAGSAGWKAIITW